MTQRNTSIITGWVAYYSQLHNIDVESECIKKTTKPGGQIYCNLLTGASLVCSNGLYWGERSSLQYGFYIQTFCVFWLWLIFLTNLCEVFLRFLYELEIKFKSIIECKYVWHLLLQLGEKHQLGGQLSLAGWATLSRWATLARRSTLAEWLTQARWATLAQWATLAELVHLQPRWSISAECLT